MGDEVGISKGGGGAQNKQGRAAGRSTTAARWVQAGQPSRRRLERRRCSPSGALPPPRPRVHTPPAGSPLRLAILKPLHARHVPLRLYPPLLPLLGRARLGRRRRRVALCKPQVSEVLLRHQVAARNRGGGGGAPRGQCLPACLPPACLNFAPQCAASSTQPARRPAAPSGGALHPHTGPCGTLGRPWPGRGTPRSLVHARAGTPGTAPLSEEK